MNEDIKKEELSNEELESVSGGATMMGGVKDKTGKNFQAQNSMASNLMDVTDMQMGFHKVAGKEF